jgi:hypothetical protein
MTIWIYTERRHGKEDRLLGFADADAARSWFKTHDPDGVAFEYPEFDVVPFNDIEGWQSVLQNGEPVWHAPEQICLRFVVDPEFREECLRSKMLGPKLGQ